ncbi:alpha/beta hydrolase [bacterium]|nr:alpha/beta hydrolase [bacterium]
MSPTTTLSQGIEPNTRAFLEKINEQKGPKLIELPIDKAREVFASLQDVPVKKAAASVEDVVFKTDTKGDINIRILRPENSKTKLPVIFYCHGAGWVFGDKNIYDRLIRDLVAGTGAALVFVDFSRSPEAKFPTAIEELYAAGEYLCKNASKYNLDTDNMFVAGDSVGGNMATVLAMMAKEHGQVKFKAQVLFYPVTNAEFDNDSYKEFAEGHFLTREAMQWFWDQYTTDPKERKDPKASPLKASVDQLKGLPEALVINGEFDVLRDEGEAYAHKLIEAQVKVTAMTFRGTIHDFVMLNSLAETPAAIGAIKVACQFIKDRI